MSLQFLCGRLALIRNIDLICIEAKVLGEQIDKLAGLANKGVHSEVFRYETRRCLIRTLLLLDDIVSLRCEPFEIKTKITIEEYLKP
jgi:hypothetical protein